MDVQQLPPTPYPISAPLGVALSLRTFHWLRDRECTSFRGAGGSGIAVDSRARRRGELGPTDPPCVGTALFMDWGGLGYFSTVAKRQGIALLTTPLVVGGAYTRPLLTSTFDVFGH